MTKTKISPVSTPPGSPLNTIAWGDGCGNYYRCVLPMRGLTRAGFITSTQEPDVSRDLSSPPDILLMHRLDDLRVRRQIRDLAGSLVVFDEDNNMLHTSYEEYNIPPGEWAEGCPPRPGEMAYAYTQRVQLWGASVLWDAREALGSLSAFDQAVNPIIKQVCGHWYMSPADRARQWAVLSAVRAASTKTEALAATRSLSPWSTYLSLIDMADVMTVSTPGLEAVYAHHCRGTTEIRVIPNCIDLAIPCYAEPQRVPHEGIIIGWAGSQTHSPDLRLLADVIATILREYDGQNGKASVSLMIGGNPVTFGEAFDGLPGAAAFAATLEQRFPATWRPQSEVETVRSACGRYIYRSYTSDTEAVPAMYADVDLGVVPNVIGTPFNTARSDVKGLEMAGVGVPCIASPIPSYVEWRKDNGTGAIVLPDNETTSWLEALRRLIDDEQLRRRMGAEALAFAQTRSIDLWAPRWMDVYTEAARRKGLAWAA